MAQLSDCFSHWSVPPSPEEVLARAKVVATHEFGDQKTPSGTTTAIVLLGVSLSRKYGIPLICQYPGNLIAEAAGVRPILVIRKHLLKPGEYLDTDEVNRQIGLACSERGWKDVIPCTHPHHLWRTGANMEKRHGLIARYPDVSGIWYDPNCSRWDLRTPKIFVPREIAARADYLYLKKNWI